MQEAIHQPDQGVKVWKYASQIGLTMPSIENSIQHGSLPSKDSKEDPKPKP